MQISCGPAGKFSSRIIGYCDGRLISSYVSAKPTSTGHGYDGRLADCASEFYIIVTLQYDMASRVKRTSTPLFTHLVVPLVLTRVP